MTHLEPLRPQVMPAACPKIARLCWVVLKYLELYLRRDLEHNVASSLPNPLFQKDKGCRVVATAATVTRPFCSQRFKKGGVPCLGMNILAICTTMNFSMVRPTRRTNLSYWTTLPHSNPLTVLTVKVFCVRQQDGGGVNRGS